jgi:FMN phosphatase YigB (HAD superfamily)
MHASKPNPAYYREIAAIIHYAPEDCVMVCNKVQNDIVPARRVGMKTFLVVNDSDTARDAPADWQGTLTDFKDLLDRGDI